MHAEGMTARAGNKLVEGALPQIRRCTPLREELMLLKEGLHRQKRDP